MTDHSALLRPAAAEFLRVAAAAKPFTAPTPCAGFDVRGLLNHLLYWGPWLVAAGRRETYTATGTEAALFGEDWLATLGKQTEDLVDAFAPAAAWTAWRRSARPRCPRPSSATWCSASS
ncbi:maleylpyruvate isomerase N-terminal domain-containing protein [Amycolatopsis sp. NPDC051373]|uniref:maleylpyruvate isomerase N-terminal domain-containing protein n=1 Tax=Amycolatopsis sp. NPDC051373 TaxID=3155801 RepID=UPI00344F75FF